MLSCAFPACVQAKTSTAQIKIGLSNVMTPRCERALCMQEGAGSANAARCASRGYLNGSSRWYRDLADILRHFVALLHRRPLGNGRVPPLDVGILAQVDRLPFIARHPRPNGDIGDGIVVGDELAI